MTQDRKEDVLFFVILGSGGALVMVLFEYLTR